MALDTIEKKLSAFEAFEDVPDAAVKRLEAMAEAMVYAPGDKIVRRGEAGDCLFLMQTGRAFATVPGSDGTPFDDFMGPGDVFGEMSLLTGEPRSADITAETKVVCLKVPFTPLRTLFAQHPDVASFLTGIVGRRLSRRDGIKHVGNYEIEAPVGGGGFASVFSAFNPDTKERVAIKMLRHELVWRADYAKRFRREAHAIQNLVHPNVVRVHGVVDSYATIFIVMELVDGIDLGKHLSKRGPLPAAAVRSVVRAVALALQEAHEKNIIHRDVKPANILATHQGTIKLVDFGVALTPEETLSRTTGKTAFTGTPHYAAPEHVLNRRMDGRTDLFMLGVTAIELLTGRTPNETETALSAMLKHVSDDIPDPREIPGMPADLGEFIFRCTRRIPDDRYASCKEAVEFLDAQGGELADPLSDEAPGTPVYVGNFAAPPDMLDLSTNAPTMAGDVLAQSGSRHHEIGDDLHPTELEAPLSNDAVSIRVDVPEQPPEDGEAHERALEDTSEHLI